MSHAYLLVMGPNILSDKLISCISGFGSLLRFLATATVLVIGRDESALCEIGLALGFARTLARQLGCGGLRRGEVRLR